MTSRSVDGLEIILWPHPAGLSAFVPPWVFDLEYDDRARATVDANRGPLVVSNYLASLDRYRVLDGPGRAKILKAALARRDDYQGLAPNGWEQYLVRLQQPGADEAAFLRIVAAFIRVWRRGSGIE